MDCGKCPLKPVYIGLIVTSGVIFVLALLGFGIVSAINASDSFDVLLNRIVVC